MFYDEVWSISLQNTYLLYLTLLYYDTPLLTAGLTFPFCLLRADQTNQSQLRASLGRVNSAQAVQYVIVMVSSDDGEGYGEANWHLHSVTELEYGRVQLP